MVRNPKQPQKPKKKSKPEVSLEEIIAKLPGHIYWKDLNGVYLGCNDMQAIDAGLASRYEMIGKTDYDMPWKETANELVNNDKKVIKTGTPLTIEEQGYLSRKVPLHNKKGNIIGILGISIEASQYKQIIEQDRQILEEVVAAMPGHVYWKNRKCILQGCNDNQARDVGLKSRLDIVGKTAYDIIMQNQPEEEKRRQAAITDAIDEEVMRTDKVKTMEEFVILPDKTKAYYLSKKVPLHDRNGKVVGLIGISFDITDRKKAEEELKLAKEKADAANKAKTEFLYNMRHDFRTPFSGILSIAQLMEKNEPDPKKKEFLGYIAQSSNVLLDQLNEILEFIELEDGSLPQLEKQFSLEQLLSDILNMMLPFAKSKNLKLTMALDANVPKFLIGDRLRINRILMNLVSNALKFTDKGSVKFTTSVAKKANKHVILKFTVRDTGVGMPEEKKDIVFDKFTRLTSAYQGLYKGKGLGLRIVKQFVEDLNGEIHIKSEINKGTVFTILIPCKTTLLNCDENNLYNDD